MSEIEVKATHPDDAVLGDTALTFDIEERAALVAVSLSMARQCAQTLTIVSRHLDPAIYDNDPFADAVKDMVLNNRYARVRLLIIDSRPLISTGHRMLEFSTRPQLISDRADRMRTPPVFRSLRGHGKL